VGLILIDKSAWVRADPEEIERHGEPCLCAITRLEILFSATSAADYDEQQAALALFRDLRVDAQTMAAAESAQHELAIRGQHRISLPDLIIGACAQQHSADVFMSTDTSTCWPTCSAFGRYASPDEAVWQLDW
jgi:predicted nucleic acid-binding protein